MGKYSHIGICMNPHVKSSTKKPVFLMLTFQGFGTLSGLLPNPSMQAPEH